MNRNYDSGKSDTVKIFTGYEVERTPAYGMKTLFIVGFEHPDRIRSLCKEHNCEHIFFGANHSYNPHKHEDWEDWENMILPLLKEGYLCSLDIPLGAVEKFNDGSYNEFDNFIPQIRVPIPYAKLWNYNTMIKIDDKDFQASNPGVWCHSLHDLMSRERFTNWQEYRKDIVIE